MTTTATKIDLEGFMGLVEELAGKQASHGVEFSQALDLLKEMAALMHELRSEEPGLKREELIIKLQECRAKLPEALARLYRSRGYSMEEALNFWNDPQNFDQERWEEIQTIRREVENRTLKSSPSSFGWLKLRKNKNK